MNKQLTLTYEETLADLRALVAERGDGYVYTMPDEIGACVYFAPDGSPSCIVGGVLARHGWTANDAYEEGVNEDTGVSTLTEDRGDGPLLSVDDRTRVLLHVAQVKQDADLPWGEAVALAVEYATNGCPHKRTDPLCTICYDCGKRLKP
jgi:hypothetical protein